MNPKTDESDQLLAAKAASKNLSVDQLRVIIELAEDLERHSDGAVQPLLLQRTDWGCELVLASINALYRLQVMRMVGVHGRLGEVEESSGSTPRRRKRHPSLTPSEPCRIRCVMETYGEGSSVLHEGPDTVESWQILRKLILYHEGWIVMHSGEVRRIEEFDTCQKMKAKTTKMEVI
jgi:hypothetical protein